MKEKTDSEKKLTTIKDLIKKMNEGDLLEKEKFNEYSKNLALASTKEEREALTEDYKKFRESETEKLRKFSEDAINESF